MHPMPFVSHGLPDGLLGKFLGHAKHPPVLKVEGTHVQRRRNADVASFGGQCLRKLQSRIAQQAAGVNVRLRDIHQFRGPFDIGHPCHDGHGDPGGLSPLALQHLSVPIAQTNRHGPSPPLVPARSSSRELFHFPAREAIGFSLESRLAKRAIGATDKMAEAIRPRGMATKLEARGKGRTTTRSSEEARFERVPQAQRCRRFRNGGSQGMPPGETLAPREISGRQTETDLGRDVGMAAPDERSDRGPHPTSAKMNAPPVLPAIRRVGTVTSCWIWGATPRTHHREVGAYESIKGAGLLLR
jgi:hypothetical protein